jgi:hypothetical protein
VDASAPSQCLLLRVKSWVYIIIKGVPLIGRLGSLITWSISTEWFFYIPLAFSQRASAR